MDEYERYDHGALLRDRYQKCGDISEGSYGLVSLAKDTLHNDILVAVKFIYPIGYKRDGGGDNDKEKDQRPSSSPAKLRSPNSKPKGFKHNKDSILNGLYQEAEKEIKIHKILGSHANISTLYDHFDSYLILDYCSRGDLYEAIHNFNGPTTTQDIKDVFQQILNALEFCHNHGVYHRDLKPENILITEDWSIKLCDWGLATTNKIITDKDEFDVGSERYMAPELFDSELDNYDASKIDLWSIGVILLTLVFHKNPFQVANYSDKRFIQFAGNREVLFDIFPRMSGDMFKVLRSCLNIDPDNRSLQNTKNDLEELRYFTIDEEYWASDYEEDDGEDEYVENENENDNDHENENETEEIDYNYKRNDILGQSPLKPRFVNEKTSQEKVSSSLSTTDNDSNRIKHYGNIESQSRVLDDFPIPHNHRADALLSSTTNLKPIPIGSFGGGGNKFRNTRKPFNVASYNQSQNLRVQQSKFNREDFFTPKSVFNHYMDKYGEQRFNNIDSKIHENLPSNGDGKKRKLRSWKKNYRKNKPRSRSGRRQEHSSQYHHGKDETSSQNNNNNQGTSHKRKSRSFSATKARKFIGTPSNVNATNSNNNTNGNAVASTFHSLAPGTPHSYGSSTGKYAPPHLRSPTYARSPVIEPVTEEMSRLNLNDEEVFHLEGDFELSEIDKLKSENESSSGYGYFKKPAYKNNNNSHSSHILISENDKVVQVTNAISEPIVPNTTIVNGHSFKNTFMGQKWPISAQDSISTLSSSANSVNGKYVPPFRRGSISHQTPAVPVPTSSGTQSVQVPIPKFSKKGKDDISHSKFLPNGSLPSAILSGTSSVNGSDGSFYRKEWSDYE
ncbi:serine/threonine protein kinase [Scheffersomyces amazonensis]|uniref:serine/threonine protein kinase n=1 Tax=Scheffersomyces amazonensis TaxID=1078765 RepID=UPI00315C8130